MENPKEFPDFIKGFPEADLPFPGVAAWLVQGADSQVVFAQFDETIDVPEHAHEEQWEIVVAGKVLLKMEGTEREYRAGESFFIPAGVPHGATVEAGYRAIIIFNEPGRYQAK